MERRRIEEPVGLFPCDGGVRLIADLVDLIVGQSEHMRVRKCTSSAILIVVFERIQVRLTVGYSRWGDIQVSVGVFVSGPVVDTEQSLIVGKCAELESNAVVLG